MCLWSNSTVSLLHGKHNSGISIFGRNGIKQWLQRTEALALQNVTWFAMI
jgi:hypothetical protein